MKREQLIKLVGLGAILLLIANVVLFSFRVIDWKVFWIVIAIAAVVAYGVVPRMKK